MKRSLLLLVVLAVAISGVSMSADSYWALLDSGDYRVEQEESLSPSIVASESSEGGHWRTFNHWMCFSTERVKVECEPDETVPTICYPRLSVEDASGRINFEILTGGNYLNSGAVLDRWTDLLGDADAVCALSAQLRDISGPQGAFFSLEQLKTLKGYWDYDSDENWREAEDEGAERK